MPALRIAFFLFVVAAVSSRAHAQGDPTMGGAPPPPPPAPAASTAWPEAVADRPYNLAAGMLELHGAMPISGAGGNTEVLLGVGAAYGLSDMFEVGGDYALQLSPNADAEGIFAGHVRVRLVHNEQMSAAVGASFVYSHSLYSNGVTVGFAGVSFRYRLSKQLSIYTDSNVCGGCVNVAGPVAGQLIFMHFTNSSGTGTSTSENLVAFTVPVGVGFQASPQLYLYGATVLGAVALAPTTDSSFIFDSLIPIVVGTWISVMPKLDVGISLTDDLKHAGDNYFVELGAKLFM